MIINQIHTSSRPAMRSVSKQGGFTLMEALISFLILSIGMLGIASLQAVSLKAGKSSVYGSVAMMKVEQLFESMRANPASLITYEGSGADNGCSTANCTPAQLAADDVFWWKKDLTGGLPPTTTTVVTVTEPVSPSKLATVTIALTWKERDKDSAGGSVDRTYSATSNICTEDPC